MSVLSAINAFYVSVPRFRSHERVLLSSRPSLLLYFDLVTLVTIAVKTSQPNIVLLRAASSCNRDFVIKLDFIILQMFAAMLTGVVVASNHPHFCRERDIPTTSAFGRCFSGCFCRKKDRANVSEDVAFAFAEHLRNILWVPAWIEDFDP